MPEIFRTWRFKDEIRTLHRLESKGSAKLKRFPFVLLTSMSMRPPHIFVLVLCALFLYHPLAQAQFAWLKKKEKAPQINEQQKLQALDHFVEGVKYANLEEYDKAYSELSSAKKLYPKNSSILFKLAEVLKEQNRITEATLMTRDALELRKDNHFYYDLLAKLYLEQNQAEKAAEVYQKVIEEFPAEMNYYYELANAYIRADQIKAAIEVYNTIEETSGINPKLSQQKQSLYLKIKKTDEALKEAQKVLEAYPENPQHLLSYAELLTNAGRIEEAIKIMEDLVEAHPNKGATHLILGELLMSQERSEEAFKELALGMAGADVPLQNKLRVMSKFMQQGLDPMIEDKAIELARILTETHPKNGQVYAVYGDVLLQDGQKQEAAKAYAKSARLDPSNFQLWRQIVGLDMELQMQDSLIVHSRKATEYFPNIAMFWFTLGNGLLDKEKYEEAIDAYEQARMLSGSDKQLLTQINSILGDAYYEIGEKKKSFESYAEALEINPGNEHAMNNYAYYLSLEGEQLETAANLAKKLVEKHPYSSTYLDTYGWVLYKQEKYEKAIEQLSKAVKALPQYGAHGEVYEHYGDALFQAGKTAEAVKYWKKAYESGGASQVIEKKIANKQLY